MAAMKEEVEEEDTVVEPAVEAAVVAVVVAVVAAAVEAAVEAQAAQEVAAVGTEAGVKPPMTATTAMAFDVVPVAVAEYTAVGTLSSMEKEQARVSKLPDHLTSHV